MSVNVVHHLFILNCFRIRMIVSDVKASFSYKNAYSSIFKYQTALGLSNTRKGFFHTKVFSDQIRAQTAFKLLGENNEEGNTDEARALAGRT